MQVPNDHQVTILLSRWREGDERAAQELIPLVYDRLRALAGSFFASEQPYRTLAPTALVHEAYLRIASDPSKAGTDRNHFFAIAARAMRQLLIDAARRRRTEKHGGGRFRITLGANVPDDSADIDLIALDDSLTRLGELDSRHARVVELRYLTGLNIREVADVLGVSRRTVEMDWRLARAWLQRDLGAELPE